MKELQSLKEKNTKVLMRYIQNLGIDLAGVADLKRIEGMPLGIPEGSANFLNKYKYAVVLGAQLGKIGHKASGDKVSLFLEKAALDVVEFIQGKRYFALIIHTEDEFDPAKRIGLMSLKVLAKAAGLGWQGRSLLVVSPEYGPIHRLIAVLTDMPIMADKPLSNECGDCSECVDKCPKGSLTLIPFKDHPEEREDVLNIITCLGDDGCMVCINVCPWIKK